MVRDAITIDLVARLFSRAWFASRIVGAIVLVAFVADISNAARAAAVNCLLIIITLGLSSLAKPAPLIPLASSAALLTAASLGHKNYSVNSVAFTPDGHPALSSSSDK